MKRSTGMGNEMVTYSIWKLFGTLLVALIAFFAFKHNQKIELTRLDNVLSGLLTEERNGGLSTDLPIAVGFGSCIDLVVDGINLMDILGLEPPKKGKYHDNIDNLEELAEMFALFLSEGAAAERYIPLPVFKQLTQAAEKLPNSRWAAGGNAPVISNRFAKEGFSKVYIGAPLSDRFNELYPSKLNFIGNVTGDGDDIHLILEYKVGEKWGNFTVSRANRFIVHNDNNNPHIQSLESFHEVIKKVNPRLVVIGGLQMLDNFPFQNGEREIRMEQLSNMLQSIPSSTLIHFEMASFSEMKMMENLVKYVFPFVDSLGMNEQELPNIVGVARDGHMVEVANANPRTATILDEIREIKNYYRKYSVRGLTRIHVHTLAFQAILVDHSSNWKNTKAGSARASLTAHRYVCGGDEVDVKKARLIMDDSFSISSGSTTRVAFNETSPISCWDEDGSEICVAPVLVCTQVKQTAGGGDNITPAGLMPQI